MTEPEGMVAPTTEHAPVAPPGDWQHMRLPPHSDGVLKRRYAHARDCRIVFYEKPHVYTVDGVTVKTSVTSLIKPFVQEFDGPGVARDMREDHARWPNPKYLRDEDRLRSVQRLLQDAAPSCAVAFRGALVDRERLCESLRSTGGEAHGLLEDLEVCMSTEEILRAWERTRVDACHRGTYLHHMIERHMNGLSVHPQYVNAPEFRQYLAFRASLPATLVPYRTEWEIFDDHARQRIAGSLDCCMLDTDTGNVTILDWKRTKSLSFSHFGRVCSGKLAHLYDSRGVKYALQLNVYRRLLENFYGLVVDRCVLVALHPSRESFQALEVEHLPDEAAFLMAASREGRKAARCVERNSPGEDAAACAEDE